jgi:hypothetical protein
MKVATVIAVTVLCSVASTALAQHRIDVSEEHKRLSDPSVREGYGIGMSCGISAIEGHRPRPLPLELTVVSLSPTDLTQGDKVAFEVMIKNIGKETIAIPWSVIGSNQLELCRTEQRLQITFTAPRAASRFPQVVLGTTLYGFPFDQSLLPLQPGETATIRADWWIRMDDLSQEPREFELTPRVALFHGGLATEEVVSENLKVRVRARPKSQ